MAADYANSWDGILQAARDAGARYPELVASQWALESGWGRSPSGKNNFFGQKGAGTVKSTQEVINGKTVNTSAGFRDFNSIGEGVKFLVDRWYKDYGGYKGINNAGSLQEAARMLKAQGYATDPSYSSKLLSIAGRGGSGSPVGGAQATVPTEQRASLISPDSGALPAVRQIPAEDVAASVAAAGLGIDEPKPQQDGVGVTPDRSSSLAGASIAAALGLPADSAKAVVESVASQPAPAAEGSTRMAGKVSIGQFYDALAATGFKVGENLGTTGRVGRHSERSEHYATIKDPISGKTYSAAADLTIQPGSPLLKGRPDADWKPLTQQWGQKLAALFPQAQILHPGNDASHSTHIHKGTRGLVQGGYVPVSEEALRALPALRRYMG